MSAQRQGYLSTASRTAEERTATEFFLVRFGAPATAVAAENAAGVPAIGAGHPDDGGRRVKGKQAKCLDESNRADWQVQVDYSSKAEDEEDPENPLDKPAEIEWSFDNATEAYFFDHSQPEKPVVNTAGEPFEKLPEREAGGISAVYKKNVPTSYNPTTLTSNMNVVNDGSFTFDGITIEDGQAKLSGGGLSGVKDENGVQYREVTIALKFRETWDDEFEDRGFNEKGGGGKLKEIVKGTPPVRADKPCPLDGAGHAKADPTAPGEKLTFKPYKRASFSMFNFS